MPAGLSLSLKATRPPRPAFGAWVGITLDVKWRTYCSATTTYAHGVTIAGLIPGYARWMTTARNAVRVTFLPPIATMASRVGSSPTWGRDATRAEAAPLRPPRPSLLPMQSTYERTNAMTLRRSALTLLLLAALLGCKVESQHEVFISELLDIGRGNQPTGEIQTRFRTTVGNRENCEKHRPNVIAIIARYHNNVSVGECKPAGGWSDLTFTATTPLVQNPDAPLPGNAVFALAARPGEKPGTVALFVALDKARLAQLQTEMRTLDSSQGTISFEPVTVTLNNDTGGSVKLRAASAFLNGEPELIVDIEVARRSRIELRLSDVTIALVGKTGKSFIARLEAP